VQCGAAGGGESVDRRVPGAGGGEVFGEQPAPDEGGGGGGEPGFGQVQLGGQVGQAAGPVGVDAQQQPAFGRV
jgi:hypothetical protein